MLDITAQRLILVKNHQSNGAEVGSAKSGVHWRIVVFVFAPLLKISCEAVGDKLPIGFFFHWPLTAILSLIFCSKCVQ